MTNWLLKLARLNTNEIRFEEEALMLRAYHPALACPPLYIWRQLQS